MDKIFYKLKPIFLVLSVFVSWMIILEDTSEDMIFLGATSFTILTVYVWNKLTKGMMEK